MRIVIETKQALRSFANTYMASRYKSYLYSRRIDFNEFVLKDDGQNVGLRGIDGVRASIRTGGAL